MADVRLRKAFKYPEDGDVPEAMDEQEQEQLIEKLRSENEDTNLEYLKLFVGLTATAGTMFLPIFFRTRLAAPKYIALLGIASLALTAYMLVLVPTKGRLVAGSKSPAAREPLVLTPAQQWLPLLNAPAAALVCYLGLGFKDSTRVHEGFWLVCSLPLIMYILIQFVRRFLVEIDVGELEDMRYEYRGA